MAKKRNKGHQQTKKVEDDKLLLQERLQGDLVEKLKAKQKSLREDQERKQEEELARRREEARLREKNKSFEELLNESSMDWNKYK
ncbi:YqkE family protein [Bacillus suaedaesalsae]|uniref:YqkE family protein n=1 Tax=Bacillus suaedaesalsae TaxID=2810349 RepID=A0ABS2DN93_9BACI|nr:YqkE family protein [Bacillus suaedaesalsae]MBM6619969.1 YqkE family protein [Bacillus suaedaesalsae]